MMVSLELVHFPWMYCMKLINCFSSYVFNTAELPPLYFKGVVFFNLNIMVERGTPQCLAADILQTPFLTNRRAFSKYS